MPILSLENLDPYNSPYYNYKSFMTGRKLFQDGQVTVTAFDGETAICAVRDGISTHSVQITAESKHRSQIACDCPQAAKEFTCKHQIAAVFAVRIYIENEARNHWRYRLQQALENTPRRKTAPGGPRNKYAILFGLLKEKAAYGASTSTFRLIPYRIKATKWNGVNALETLADRPEQNAKLDRDRGWIHAVESVPTLLDHRAVINLPLEGVHLYNVLLKLGSYGYGYSYGLADFSSYLALLSKIDAPVFLMTSHSAFKERLQLITEPVTIEAALAFDGKNYTLQAGATLHGEIFTTIKGSLEILSTQPAWALVGRHIVPVSNPEALSFLQTLPLTIPEKDQVEFREKYFHSVAERIPIQGDVIAWVDVEENPVPRLYLRDEEGVLRAELRFGYGEHEVALDPKGDAVTVRDLPKGWSMLRIHRRKDEEERLYQLLSDPRYSLKRASSLFPPGTFELRARIHPFDFLLHTIPRLANAGFEVFGEDKLKSGRINRSQPSISLNITSGVDWFDIKAAVHYGDMEVDLSAIRRALRNRERYVKLADGSVGQIPEEWLERYKKLFDLAEDTQDGLRVRDYHLPLVDTLLDDAGESQVAAEFQQRRERLRSFEHIQPQPVPQGFIGELRPYQKAGLDWLHFLYEYGFGGCLADDMGLGKTIQVLAFLQSLKEQGKMDAPSLLVVPKSLIANWQRESERFTPGLRILEFMGNTRVKDPAVFGEYDIILTTYGTMLRDIEFLRGFHFLYTILDESQNIKNPLAQSSKAARLLKAGHRLVMTGTPVENNTFEIWSQFAFLNPGLLGHLDYFKREFSNPIESRSNEETMLLLRRLVYPFILRRSKEQVAPELPPRTERILYTDLGPAQRRFYTQTRDYYRGMLIGLIDKQGIDDVRMKILEGLLRLRQICIHPMLVDSTYRGEAAKFEILHETLETLRAEGHKALVFSQFVQTLQILRSELDDRQIRYAYLDGQTENRQEQVDRFQEDPTLPFFLISLKAGGVGLNLTAADYVIHVDPWWNPAVEMQAADRTHRIGQEKPVFIYKIIARNSIEEKILQLQEHKKELVEQLITSEGSFFKSITKEDVRALFS